MKITQSLFLLLATCAHVADGSKMMLSGNKEVPSVSSDVTGTFKVTLSDDGQSMDFEMDLLNPSGIEIFGVAGAHIHCGGAGENGEVVLALNPAVADTSAEISITGTLTGADVFDNTSDCKSDITGFYTDILLGRAYVNVHSTDNGSGEVRGQYDDNEIIEVKLGGENEVPMVTSVASGTAMFTSHPQGVVGYTLEITNPANIDFYGAGVHIHCGGIAMVGPVVVILVAGGSGFTSELLTSEITLTDADVANTECGSTILEVMNKLKLGEAYVNAHSEANPNGEIRGTGIELEATTFPLSGEYEVPSVDSSVTGTATFAHSTGMLKFEIEIINPLERKIFGAAGAHIHCGGPDEAGPVAAFMVDELAGGNDANMITETGLLTDEDVIDVGCGATIDELKASIYEGTAYVNVHSFDLPGGATRGQVGVPSDDEPDDSGSTVLTSGAFGVIFSVAALMVTI